jgi:hypothetical protein
MYDFVYMRPLEVSSRGYFPHAVGPLLRHLENGLFS